MNLEELQIKIGIELKELNKQLKKASDDINEYLGPKATKKMMADNNKVIKDGFKIMEKTTKDSAKQINRDLNNAFDIDKTLVKFNKSIDRSMEQAKRSVRSACNDIRRELNAALNVRANIRVSASASAQRQSLGAKSDAAVIMASSQYTAAMIVKAINAMIGTNNKNTARLEGAINKSTDKIVSAINKQNAKNSQNNKKSGIKANVEADIKVLEDGLQSKINKAIQSINVPSLKVSIEVDKSNLQNEIDDIVKNIKTQTIKIGAEVFYKRPATTEGTTVGSPYGPDNKALIEALKNAYKSINILNRNLGSLNNLKQLGTGPYGSNKPVGGTVNWRQGRPDETITSFEGELVNPIAIPKEPLKQIQDVIEGVNYTVKDLEKTLMNTSNFDLGKEGVLDTSQVDALKQVHNLKQKISSAPLMLTSQDDALDSIQQKLNKIKEDVNFTITEEISSVGVNPDEFKNHFGDLEDYGDVLHNFYEDLRKLDDERITLDIDTEDARKQIADLQEIIGTYIKSIGDGSLVGDIRSATGVGDNQDPTPRKQKKGGPPKPTIMGFGFGAYKNEIDSLIEYAKKAGRKIKEAFSGPDEFAITIDDDDANGFNKTLEGLTNTFEKYKAQLAKVKKEMKTLNLPGSGNFTTTPEGPRLPGSGGRGTSGIRPGSGNFTFGGYVDDAPTLPRTGRQFDSHVAIHKAVKAYEKIKEKLNEIKDEYKKLANTISKITNKITAPLKKILSGLKGVAGGVKTAWNKITSIFKKGAKDCEKATNGLSLKLKDLLKTALSFGSIYGLINLGKQAVVESQELAQAESKLTALMRQRMGATNDTVRAIRELASEQAKAGVVSETAMVKGAEQLSMYVHSAKALKELIPAIANMTARRGGLFATPDDAEEIATQLGEAIREGTTTPLEQSGIYLSEAEIEKFKKLRTEEARAAYLADVIAENVGDINKALANTPHGQIAQLKNNFKALLGTLGTLLVNVIQPIVKWLNVIVVAATNALKALGELLGFDMSGGGLMGVGDIGSNGAGGIDSATDSLEEAEDAAGAAEEAVEKFKGSLMGFDEINILSDKDKKEDDPTNITPGEGGQLTPGEYVPPEITEGENIFTKFGEKMKAFLDEFLEPFKAAWDLLGDDLKAEWADLIDSFKHFCDSLGSFLKSVWDNGGKEFVQHMAEIGLACAKAAMEIGGEILDSLARLWDHLDPSKNMHTQRLLDVLNEVSEKIRDFILGLGDHFESLMANGGQDVLNAMGDCFMDLGAAAVNGLGVAIDALDGLIDHLDPAVNENTRNMLQALADMFHATGQAAWDFSELLRSALENGGQDMINAFGDMMMNLGETVARVITTMMESFSKFFDYIDPAKNDITKGMMKAWEEAFLAIGDAALGFAELFESVMANGGQDVLNKLGDAFNSLVGLVGTCVQEIADAMNGLFEHLDPKTNEFTQNMLKAWEGAFESISGMAKDIGEVLGSVMDNGGQEVVNAIGDLGVKIVGAFGKVTGTVADCVGDLFKHLDPAENDIAKGALESFEYFINSIGDFVDSLADALGTFMDNGGQEFVNNMGDIIALIGDLAFTIGGDILNAISTFMDSWLGHAVISTCATALELVSEVLKGLLEILEPLSPIISGVVAAIGGFMVAQKVVGFISSIVTVFQTLGGAGGILALVKGGFTALWAVLAANPIAATVAAIVGIGVAIVALYNKCEGFREFIDKILAGFQDLFNELKEHFSNLLEDVRNIFGNVIDIITGIFEGDGEKVGEAVRNLILNIVDLMMDMNKAFVEVGWALIKGLVQGIWECIKAIPSLLAGIGEFVVDFFKGLFGIHSPSTVFAELGKNLIEGLVKGITDSINLVTGAFKKVCDAITNTIKDISKAVSDKFKEIKDGISEKLKETKEVVSEKWSEIKTTVSEKAKETYDAAKDNWANLKQTVSERARETYEAVKGNWENLKQNTIDRFKETYDVAQEKFTNIREAIKEKATKTFEDVSNSWTKIKEDAGNKLEQIKTDAEKRYEGVKNTLVNKIEEAKKGIVEKWEEVRNKTNECIENVRQTSEEKYNEIKETIVNRLEDIKSSTEKKWEEIKKNTGTAVENIKKEAEEQYGKIKDSLLDTLEKTKSAMATKWENIKTDAINKVSEIVKQATTKFGEIKKNFGDKLDEVKSSLTSKWKSLSTQAFNGAKNMVSQAKSGLSKIGSTISDAITGSKSKVKSALNEVGKVFSQADWSLPKLKMPHIKITGKWGFNPPSWPKFSVEWYKRGGIIDGITPLGMTGGTMHMAGEAGKEMVVPLENTSFTTKIAKAMGQAVDNAMARNNNNNNNNSSPFVNNNGDIILQVDGREFARCSINQINKLQRESGRTLLDV